MSMPAEKLQRRGRGKTKNQLRNQAVRTWVCLNCHHWHQNRGNQKGRPSTCSVCGHPDFHYFASEAEAKYNAHLELQQRHGLITHLDRQVVFPFKVNGVEITTYRADFTYREKGQHVVVDVKPKASTWVKTGNGWKKKPLRDEVFRLKKKMMVAFYGIEIKEVNFE